ncbi:MAG: hypothetical protein KGL39_42610 [Patescibacteria group bacterium]|nr:hypothetical protein [Patescibacteria group bacterium]
MKIRNARDYQTALDRLREMETRSKYAVTIATNQHDENEMLALAEAVDAYELNNADARDYARRK